MFINITYHVTSLLGASCVSETLTCGVGVENYYGTPCDSASPTGSPTITASPSVPPTKNPITSSPTFSPSVNPSRAPSVPPTVINVNVSS